MFQQGRLPKLPLTCIKARVPGARRRPWSATWHCYLVLSAPPDTSWCTAWSQAGEGSRERLRNLRDVMRTTRPSHSEQGQVR
jgi:hypothetical protein